MATAREIYARLKERVTALGRLDVRPRLVAIEVGDHPASRIYLRNKVRDKLADRKQKGRS